jgi:hypothetical protein
VALLRSACLTSSLSFYAMQSLTLRGSVARVNLMDELGAHPLQVHWLKACVTFFRAACASQHSSPLFFRAMYANVILSRHSDVAWCAKLAKYLAVIGVEGSNGTCIGYMDAMASTRHCLFGAMHD